VNKGVLCGKGSAGIMQHYSPARLQARCCASANAAPATSRDLLDEALALAAQWLGDVRMTDPKKLAFFTGRDQSQSLTAVGHAVRHAQFRGHGGFCSVNMAAAGMYTFGARSGSSATPTGTTHAIS